MAFDFAQTQCRHGLMAYNAGDTTIGASLTRYGEWAEHELEFLSRLIPEGATVLDVGGNIGCHTVAFSRMVGATGRVIAFEPFADNFAMLRLNTRKNENVTVVQALVGASESVLALDLRKLSAPGENYGAISYRRVPTISGDQLLEADIAVSAQVTLDMFAALPVDFIKIDVEGMEFDALAGARALLLRRAPIIYFEQNGPAMFAAIHGLLSDLGYQLFWHVCYPFNRQNFRGSDVNIFGEATELNVLAVPRARFESDPALFERIRFDVNEARTAAFDRPLAMDPAAGRDVADWASLRPST